MRPRQPSRPKATSTQPGCSAPLPFDPFPLHLAKESKMAAFVHVRKAYRLLWLYQQTLMDTCNELVRHLNVRYYRTELDPLQRTTNPAQKPPRALLPLLWISTLYL